MTYLLDTNICVFFLRGKYVLDKMFKKVGLKNLFISEVTVLELKFGAENSINPKKSHEAVDVFLKGMQILPVTTVIEKYAQIKVHLNKQGKPIHDEFDLIIGLTALTNNHILITDNLKDFKNIPKLKCDNWIVRV
jgi:tRNA(fMet)-specific endonuclease VapC